MKIKEVSAGVKISQNYNSYSMNLIADLGKEESPEKVGEILIEKAMKIVKDKLEEKNNFDKEVKFKQNKVGVPHNISSGLIEVGAAWPHKKSSNFLSVKLLEDGRWEDVRIKNLEKIDEGYKQKNNKGIFIFRKIPNEKRTNYKMPMFRIYKMEEYFK